MSLILITHDLRLAFSTCDRVYVLYAGSLLEVGDAKSVESDPQHPYTLGLLLSEPPAEKRVPRLIAIRGSVPAPRRRRGPLRLRRPLRLGSGRLPGRKARPLRDGAGTLLRLHPPARHRGGDARSATARPRSRRPLPEATQREAAAHPREQSGQDLPRPPRPRRSMR